MNVSIIESKGSENILLDLKQFFDHVWLIIRLLRLFLLLLMKLK